MAFAQNVVADRRRRIHSRACRHGRRVRFRRTAMELASAASSRGSTKSDTTANGQPHAIAELIATISSGCSHRPDVGHSGADGHPFHSPAVSSSDGDPESDPPDAATATDTDSLDPPHADADG